MGNKNRNMPAKDGSAFGGKEIIQRLKELKQNISATRRLL